MTDENNGEDNLAQELENIVGDGSQTSEEQTEQTPAPQPGANQDMGDVEAEVEEVEKEDREERLSSKTLAEVLKANYKGTQEEIAKVTSTEIKGLRKAVYVAAQKVGINLYTMSANSFIRKLEKKARKIESSTKTYNGKVNGTRLEAGLNEEVEAKTARAKRRTFLSDRIDSMLKGIALEKSRLDADRQSYSQLLEQDSNNVEYRSKLNAAESNLSKIAEDQYRLGRLKGRVDKSIKRYHREVTGKNRLKGAYDLVIEEGEDALNSLYSTIAMLTAYIKEQKNTLDIATFFKEVGEAVTLAEKGAMVEAEVEGYMVDSFGEIEKESQARRKRAADRDRKGTDYDNMRQNRSKENKQEIEAIKAVYR